MAGWITSSLPTIHRQGRLFQGPTLAFEEKGADASRVKPEELASARRFTDSRLYCATTSFMMLSRARTRSETR